MSVLMIALAQASVIAAFLFAAQAQLARRRPDDPVFCVGGALVVVGALGLLQFWIAYAHYPLSLAVKGGLWLGGAWLFIDAVRDRALMERAWREGIVDPALGLGAASVLLVLWVHGAVGIADPFHTAAARWTPPLPMDNELPFVFAEFLRAGHVPSPMIGDWLSSDRPPLQVGLYLLLGLPFGPSAFVYQTCGVTLQLFCLVGVWALARACGAARSTATAAMIAAAFTPIVLVNGGFVWPKLLPAAFLCIALAFHFLRGHAAGGHAVRIGAGADGGPAPGWLSGAVVGAAAALGMLGHGASAFAVAGMGLAALALARLGPPRHIAGAVVAAAVLYTPWILYQTFVDPPGNRLLKWHLAGVVPIDGRSVLEALRDGLEAQTARQWIDTRVHNALIIVGDYGRMMEGTAASLRLMLSGEAEAAREALKFIRFKQLYHYMSGLGLLGITLYALPAALLARRTRAVAAAVLLTLAVWLLLIFGTGETVNPHGSFLMQLATLVVGMMLIEPLGRFAVFAVVAAQAALTVYQYAF